MRQRVFCLLIWLACMNLTAQRHYTFANGTLGNEWQYSGEPDRSKYTFTDGKLRLIGSIYELCEEKPSTFLGLPTEDGPYEVNTKMSLFDAENGDEAGLCVYQSRQGHVKCGLVNVQGGRRIRLKLQLLSHQLQLADQSLGMLTDVWMRVKCDGEKLTFFYSTNGEQFRKLNEVECHLIAPDVVGGGEHPLVGMYAYNANTKYNAGYTFADFEFFDYQETQ